MSGARGERDLYRNKNPWQSPFKLTKKINKYVNLKKKKKLKKKEIKKERKLKKKEIKKKKTKKKKQPLPRFEPGGNGIGGSRLIQWAMQTSCHITNVEPLAP